jgi:hypothetical protein
METKERRLVYVRSYHMPFAELKPQSVYKPMDECSYAGHVWAPHPEEGSPCLCERATLTAGWWGQFIKNCPDKIKGRCHHV